MKHTNSVIQLGCWQEWKWSFGSAHDTLSMQILCMPDDCTKLVLTATT